MNPRLVKLYQKMADHTKPECAKCRVPYDCCEKCYCESARAFAKAQGVELKETGFENPKKLPFMGPNGCVVPPHLRPLCSVHACIINSLGHKPRDARWTKRYFKLRDQIEELEDREPGNL